MYRGKQIFFYKRAQIFVSGLIAALGEKKDNTIKLKNIEELTMFADYRVP